MPSLLALPVAPSDFGDAQVFHGICLIQRALQNAGRSFFERYEKSPDDESPKSDSSSGGGGGGEPGGNSVDEEHDVWDEKHKNDKKKKDKIDSAPTKLKKLIEGPNLYVALGLNDNCNLDSIRKAYRKLALSYHPDKQKSTSIKGEAGDVTPRVKELAHLSDDEMFLLIQDAYETLSDPSMRRQYDSALPFDESVPSPSDIDKDDPESFFKHFTPVFQRNARWSSKKPVPNLGCPNTAQKDVTKFYSFWWSFDSNRDFSMHDEYDVVDAECREERRWMEKQNQKSKKKYLADEKARIVRLTDLAYSLDPRVKAAKEQEKLRKDNAKAAKKLEAESKLEQQRLAEQQKLDAELEIKRREEEARKQGVAERQAVKAILKKNRQRFRELCQPAVEKELLSFDDVQEIALSMPIPELEKLVSTLEAAVSPSEISGVCSRIQDSARAKENEKRSQATVKHSSTVGAHKVGAAPSKKPDVEWSLDELSLLAKGVQKYPGGTARRWQLIAGVIGTKTVEQILQKTKELADGTSLKSIGSSVNSFNQFLREHDGNLRSVGAEPDTRYDDDDDDSASPEVSETSTAASSSGATQSTDSSAPSSTSPSIDVAEAAVKANRELAPVWTEQEQQCLEAALKKHPPTLPVKARWTLIAADCPGHTPKECLIRFKEIKQAILSQQPKI